MLDYHQHLQQQPQAFQVRPSDRGVSFAKSRIKNGLQRTKSLGAKTSGPSLNENSVDGGFMALATLGLGDGSCCCRGTWVDKPKKANANLMQMSHSDGKVFKRGGCEPRDFVYRGVSSV